MARFGVTDAEISNQLQAMSNGIPYSIVSDEMRQLAERIAQQSPPSSDINVEEWAKRLADDIAGAND